MRQLFQDPKAGTVQVVDVPEPALRPGTLLVRNVRSVISPGTERAAVETARSSYLKTARNRPDLVRKVMDSIRREGLLAAYRKVQTKLAEPQALGYSSAGVVVAVGPGAGDRFQVGDRVACAGAGIASHAETICVPVNLAAQIPDGVSFDLAAFATLGAIALHGVRQMEPRLGDRHAVIGLGILGLMSVQLLRAHGARVAGFDLAPDLVERARSLGIDVAAVGSTDDQVQTALAWTGGVGVDGVVVTAASPSDAPMVAAAGMCRERGRVVAVGLVPFGLPREIAYPKELELRIARSYGPGRYDAGYEEKGLDYPIGYVRWTETRNLEAFLECLGSGQVEIGSLITHRYRIEDAPAAYDELVAGGGPRPLGMVIEYPEPSPEAETKPVARPSPGAVAAVSKPIEGDLGVAFVGAGAFARSVLLPAFRGRPGVRLRRVVEAQGLLAYDAQRKFGFEEIGTDLDEALADDAVHLVCVLTRHDQHGPIVAKALRAGKHVFVEKPLALSEEHLREVEEAAASAPGLVLVGFNRRFSPMAKAIREAMATRGPLLMAYRVNAGALPPGHWTTDPEIGGGRIVGEGCHFIDLLSFLTGDAGIVSVEAACAGRPEGLTEDAAIQLAFADGSVGQILYTASGEPSIGKERLEVHAGGASAVLEDYRTCTIHRGRKGTKVGGAGKGHAEEVAALVEAARRGGPSPIPLRVLIEVTRATFEVHRSLAGGAKTSP